MKTFNRISLIVLVCANCFITANTQNSLNLPVGKRDSLIFLAKEVILKLGPDYYREYKTPVIEERKGEANRTFYRIIIPYDQTQEKLEWFNAAEVDIWADTFEPFGVLFGCNLGINIRGDLDWRNDNTYPVMEYQDATRPILPGTLMVTKKELGGKSPEAYKDEYEKKYPFNGPVIVTIIPESAAGNPEQWREFEKQAYLRARENPVNIEELLRKGFVLNSDGQWVKTRPDVPPHKRKQEFQSNPAER